MVGQRDRQHVWRLVEHVDPRRPVRPRCGCAARSSFGCRGVVDVGDGVGSPGIVRRAGSATEARTTRWRRVSVASIGSSLCSMAEDSRRGEQHDEGPLGDRPATSVASSAQSASSSRDSIGARVLIGVVEQRGAVGAADPRQHDPVAGEQLTRSRAWPARAVSSRAASMAASSRGASSDATSRGSRGVETMTIRRCCSGCHVRTTRCWRRAVARQSMLRTSSPST